MKSSIHTEAQANNELAKMAKENLAKLESEKALFLTQKDDQEFKAFNKQVNVNDSSTWALV